LAQTGRNRTINRQKLDRTVLEQQIGDPHSLRHQVFRAYRRLLDARASEPAFHPQGDQQVLELDERIFSLLRTSPDGDRRVLCLHNVSDQVQTLPICPAELDLPAGKWRDLISGQEYKVEDEATLPLQPYAVLWLKP
jgi:sucrose phosphorylase